MHNQEDDSNESNYTTFEKWFIELKNLMMQGKHGFNPEDIEAVDFEEEFWKEFFDKGMSPEKALLQDRDEE